jgi:hypothetical protein
MTTTSINGFQSMKTMLDLLIRLQEMRCCCERTVENPQLTDGEKAVACYHKTLVRECLPAEVLAHYDRMKESDPELLECPEVFAMAVLVSTYRGSSPRKRGSLLKHFATPAAASGKKAHQNGKPRTSRNGVGRCKTVRADFVGRP